MGRPAVVGAVVADDRPQGRGASRVDGTKISEGDRIAIDGTKGCVTLEDVPLVDPEVNEYFERVLKWADEIRRLGVRANADTPEDATKARELGAEGIGLCRTEHMFMAEDRQPKMRAMIMADDEEGRREALAELLPFQQEDFEGLFEAMKGLPVTIRLLDPPLHEFLKNLPDLRAQVERARIECTDDLEQLEKTLARVEEIHEENPMLGTRGCRLGILYPEIYEMQVEAIMRAVAAMDSKPHPEIMIPLIDYEHELEILRELVVADRRRARPARGQGLHGRDDDRAAARVLRGRQDRPARGLLLVRHERPHADRARVLARRRRVEVRARLHGAQDHRPLAVRDDRQAGRGVAGAARGVGRAGGPPGAQARGSAASTAAIRSRSTSSTWPGSTTSPARRSACRSRAWPPHRRKLHTRPSGGQLTTTQLTSTRSVQPWPAVTPTSRAATVQLELPVMLSKTSRLRSTTIEPLAGGVIV